MNYYLLSLINNFESKKLCEEIAISISPIVDSPNLKFHHSYNQILFYFGTETEKSEIYQYVEGVLHGFVDIFVLTEVVDEFTAFLPKEIRNHLFDLENVGENVTMKIDMERIKNNLDFSFEDEDDEDDDDDEGYINDSPLWSKIENMIPYTPAPTLDQLLDKLYSEGMNSLSGKEKNLLKTYSQN
jgi:hypothetical protein